MKKLLSVLLAVAMVLSLGAFSLADSPITLTVWGAEEDQALLTELIEQFKAAYPDQTFDIQLGVVSESAAKDTVLTDLQAAADVYAFANDQLSALVEAGALLPLDDTIDQALTVIAKKSLAEVKAANVASSVDAASKDGVMYAFPMGAGNNYFLFYDSSIISEEQAASWDGLLAAASAAGKKVGMTLASGRYNASFFLGAGFPVSTNEDGTTALEWNGTSSTGISGVDVVKGMQAIAGSEAFMAIPDGGLSNAINSGDLAAVVGGTLDAGAVEANFGGYAATKLPTFTVGDQQVQMGCYSGFELIGVNPYSENAGWAVVLAEFLTNEAAQIARFQARQLAPTNLVAASGPAVTENIAIAASVAQDAFGAIQNVGGKYWDPTASFGEQIAQGTIGSDDAAIQTALDQLVEDITAPVE